MKKLNLFIDFHKSSHFKNNSRPHPPVKKQMKLKDSFCFEIFNLIIIVKTYKSKTKGNSCQNIKKIRK